METKIKADIDTKPSLKTVEAAPLYEQVKRQISEMILLGTWPPGSQLPTEPALAESMGVALGTVRRALSELANEGLIARRRKTGTVVTGRMPQHSLRMVFQYFRLHGPNDNLVRSTAKVVFYEQRQATASECEQLDLSEGTRVHVIARVRSVDGKPIMHDRIILPLALAPGINSAEDIPELLYLHLLEKYGVRISAMREKMSADFSTEQDQEYLKIPRQFPVLRIDETAFDQQGRPVLLAFHRAQTEEFKYINEVN